MIWILFFGFFCWALVTQHLLSPLLVNILDSLINSSSLPLCHLLWRAEKYPPPVWSPSPLFSLVFFLGYFSMAPSILSHSTRSQLSPRSPSFSLNLVLLQSPAVGACFLLSPPFFPNCYFPVHLGVSPGGCPISLVHCQGLGCLNSH